MNKIGITRPLAMSQTDYAKSAKYKHNTKRRNFLAVSSNLASPMFSFSIDGKHGIVVDDYDGDGNKLLIAIHENKISGHDNVDAIKSIYGIQNPAEWLNNQIKSGATFTLFDEKRANTFLHSYGYSASLKEGIHSTEDNVTQQAENVNGILKSSRNQTKTENFKRWFGDWQNDPANASKVVDADGEHHRRADHRRGHADRRADCQRKKPGGHGDEAGRAYPGGAGTQQLRPADARGGGAD